MVNGRDWGLSLFYLAEKYHFNRVHEYPSNNILILSYDRKLPCFYYLLNLFLRDKINEAIKKHEKDGSLEGICSA